MPSSLAEREALGAPQRRVVVAREVRVGEGRAAARVARVARDSWWRRCIFGLVVGVVMG